MARAGRRWHGFPPSGEIADSAFYQLCERQFVLQQSVRQRFHVSLHCRFRDDILLCMGARQEDRLQFMAEIKRRANYCLLTVDAVESTSIRNLDLEIY